MTTLRQPYYELSPEVYSALVQAKNALEKSTLDHHSDGADLPACFANKWLCILPGDAQ